MFPSSAASSPFPSSGVVVGRDGDDKRENYGFITILVEISSPGQMITPPSIDLRSLTVIHAKPHICHKEIGSHKRLEQPISSH